MADSPSHSWEGNPRILKARAVDTRMAGNSRGGHKTVTEVERYKTPTPSKTPSDTVITTGREDDDKQADDEKDTKAVSAKKSENKSVKSAAKK